MNEMKVFTNEEFGAVRVEEIEGKPWFLAADVCRALEVKNSRDAIARLDEDEKNTVVLTDGTPGNPNMTIINEAGLYALVLSSRKPEAKAFKRWITHEVIPSIRKHGAYMTDDTVQRALEDPDFLIELATRLKEEKEKRRVLEENNRVKDRQIAELQPKGIFADAVSTSHTSILIGELAKILKGNGVEIGQNRLFRWLRENGYLIRRDGADFNMPTQKAMEKGLFRIKETAITKPDGSSIVTKTVKVTGEGQVYFVNLFLKKGIVA